MARLVIARLEIEIGVVRRRGDAGHAVGQQGAEARARLHSRIPSRAGGRDASNPRRRRNPALKDARRRRNRPVKWPPRPAISGSPPASRYIPGGRAAPRSRREAPPRPARRGRRAASCISRRGRLRVTSCSNLPSNQATSRRISTRSASVRPSNCSVRIRFLQILADHARVRHRQAVVLEQGGHRSGRIQLAGIPAAAPTPSRAQLERQALLGQRPGGPCGRTGESGRW